ncbi:hypothetical protein EGN34_03535 [Enterococcus faecalis]|nr:hypothetical protein [Enterococcus faecalis]
MLFNFWRISAYFRRSWFCFRRLSGFDPGAKIQSDFCSRLVYFLKSSYVKKHRPSFIRRWSVFLFPKIIKNCNG